MTILAKTRGAVGCAHCQGLGVVTATCDICRRLICPRCGVDTLASCPEPAAPALAMGFGRRLLCVDERGRLAVVFGLKTWVLDLQRRCWVDFNPTAHRLQMGPWPVLSEAGLVSVGLSAEPAPAGELPWRGKKQLRWDRLVVDELRPGGQRHEIRIGASFQLTSLTLCEQGTTALLVGERQVCCVDLRTRKPIVFNELPATVAAYSSRAGLLAMADEERLVLRRWRDGSAPDRLADWELPGVTWLGVAGSRIVALARGELRAWNLADWSSPPLHVRAAAIAHPALCSLSADGRLVAVADGERIQVHDLEGRALQVLEGHRREVTFVRFARGGDWLITAAANNQVIQWSRRQGGFADHVVEVKVPRKTREFPD